MGSAPALSMPKVIVGMLSLPTVWSHRLTWVQLPPKLSTCCPFSHDMVSLRFLGGEFRRDPAAYAETPDGVAKPLPALNAILYPRHCAYDPGESAWGSNTTVPPSRPAWNSLVRCGVIVERNPITPAKRLLSWPPTAGLPSTVPVPGETGIMPFKMSGTEIGRASWRERV